MKAQEQRITAIPGATRDIDITPPGWALSDPEADFVTIGMVVCKRFPELLSITIGRRSIVVKLQVCEEIPYAHVMHRRALAIAAIYGQDEQRAREELLDGDGPNAKALAAHRQKPHPGAKPEEEKDVA